MVRFEEEKFEDIIDEMKPLLQEHYKEIAMYKDKISLNPNYELYQAMADAGTLHILAARHGTVLVGYCVTFVNKHPHYNDHLYAVNDVVYLDPAYRHSAVAPEMIAELERMMLEKGVSVMTFHMKTYQPFETLMDFMGFEKAEYLYSKYIKD